MTGTVIAQAVPVLISPVLSRFYTPADFGVYALYVSLTSVFAVLATGRYEFALMLPKSDRKAFHILILIFSLSVGFAFVLLVGAIFFGDFTAELLKNKSLRSWLYFVPLGVMGTAFFKALNYWNNRQQKYGTIAKSNISKGLTVGMVNLSWMAISKGPAGLILGHILSWSAAAVYLGRTLARSERNYFKAFKLSSMKKIALRYKKFPIYSTWSGLFNSVSVQIPIFLLSYFFAEEIVGHYSFSHRLLSMPMTVLGMAIGQVFFKKAAEQKDNPLKLKKITYELYKKLVIIGMLPMLVLTFFADIIFPFIFGNEWLTAGQYTQYLSLWILFVFISSPLGNLFSVLEKQQQGLIFNILLLVTRVIALLIGGLYFQDALISVILFGGAGVVFWSAYSFYLLYLVKINIFKAFLYTFIRVGGISAILYLIRYLFI